jgi:hypothetical protein
MIDTLDKLAAIYRCAELNSHYEDEFHGSVYNAFPALIADWKRLTAERDAALKSLANVTYVDGAEIKSIYYDHVDLVRHMQPETVAAMRNMEASK